MIAIKTADLTQDFKKIADRIVAGETVLVSRPRNENLVVITEREYNELNESRKKLALARFRENIKSMQKKSIKNETADMAMDEIDSIIAEVRQENIGLQ